MAIDETYFARAEGEGTRRKATAATRRRKATGRASQREQLTRDDWIGTARAALIKGGIGAVRIVPLARALGVTRGGFYWHFKGRKDLLNALLEDWESTNTAPFERIVEAPSRDGMAEFKALVDLWISESEYNPAWDSALRNWAALSRQAAAVVKRVDERRIGIIRQIFIHLGFRDPEALVRARITYFHQVGYYTLGLAETRERRLELLPVYTASLVGAPPR